MSDGLESAILALLKQRGAIRRRAVYTEFSVHRNTFARAEKRLLERSEIWREGHLVGVPKEASAPSVSHYKKASSATLSNKMVSSPVQELREHISHAQRIAIALEMHLAGTEVHSEMHNAGEEVHSKMHHLAAEMHNEPLEVRSEMHLASAETHNVSEEVHSEMHHLDAEMHSIAKLDGAFAVHFHENAPQNALSRTRVQAVPISLLSISNEIEQAGNAHARAFFRTCWSNLYQEYYPGVRAPYVRRLEDLGLETLTHADIERRLRRFFTDPGAVDRGHPVGWLVAGWETNYAEWTEGEAWATRCANLTSPDTPEPCAPSRIIIAQSSASLSGAPPSIDQLLRQSISAFDYEALTQSAWFDSDSQTLTVSSECVERTLRQDVGAALRALNVRVVIETPRASQQA